MVLFNPPLWYFSISTTKRNYTLKVPQSGIKKVPQSVIILAKILKKVPVKL